MYTDKPLAIIRELSCNAHDSHIAAGWPEKQFEIHLPTRLDPMLRVKDFGLGLCQEDIFGIYTTYFDSNKILTNKQTGGLGLGSKSPFSYVDTYTVISIFEGEKKTYTAFIGPEGTPCISLLATEASTDCNGVEIVLPIKPQDYNNFQVATCKVLRYFEHTPKVTGMDSYREITPLTYTTRTDTFGLSDDINTPTVIQGTVGYPLKLSLLNLSEGQRRVINNLDPILFCPIGSVDIAPSREELSYDPQTINYLTDYCLKILKQMQDEMNKELDSKADAWEAQLHVWDDQYKMQQIYTDVQPPQYKQMALSLKNRLEFKPSYSLVYNHTPRSRYSRWSGNNNPRPNEKPKCTRQNYSFAASRTSRFFYNDIDSHNKSVQRLKLLLTPGSQEQFVLIERDDLADLMTAHPQLKWEKISSLPEPAKAAKGQKANTRVAMLLRVSRRRNDGIGLDQIRGEVDLKDYKYYIKCSRGEPDYDIYKKGASWLLHNLHLAITYGVHINTDEIIGIPKTQWKLIKHTKLQDIGDILVPKVKAAVKGRNLRAEFAYLTAQNAALSGWPTSVREALAAANGAVPELAQLQRQYKVTLGQDVTGLYQLARKLDIVPEVDEGKQVTIGTQVHEQIASRYPLLSFIESWSHHESELKAALNDYIQ
jgi:hypothetical protein